MDIAWNKTLKYNNIGTCTGARGMRVLSDISVSFYHKDTILSMILYDIVGGPFYYVPIDHQPLTTLEQWKASRHRLL